MPKVLFVVPHLSNSVRLLADYLRYLDGRSRWTLYALTKTAASEHEFPVNCRKLFQPATSRRRALPSQLWNSGACARAGPDRELMELTPTYVFFVVVVTAAGQPVIGWVHAHLSRVFRAGPAAEEAAPAGHASHLSKVGGRQGCADGVGDDLRNTFRSPMPARSPTARTPSAAPAAWRASPCPSA